MWAIIVRVYIIYGIMWSGKTMLTTCLAGSYERVYANYEINWLKHFEYFRNINYIKKLKFSPKKGLMILDESLINANSKDYHSKNNRSLVEEVVVYCRKLNLDLAFNTQIDDGIDRSIRKVATHWINCMNIGNENYPYFLIKYQKRIKNELVDMVKHKVDLLLIMRKMKLSYDTLEMSTNEKIKSSKMKKDYKEDEIENEIIEKITKTLLANTA